MRSKFETGLLAGVIANALIQLLGAVSGIVLARVLGPAGRGDYAVAMFWPQTVASLALLGIDATLAREAARENAHLGRILLLSFAIGAGMGAIAIVAGYFSLSAVLGPNKAHLYGVAVQALFFVPFSLFNIFLAAVFLGSGQYALYNLARITFYPVHLALLGSYAAFGNLSVEACVVLFVFAAALAPVLNALLLVRKPHFEFPRNCNLGKDSLSLISRGGPNAASFIVYVFYVQLPMLVLTQFESSSGIGLFVVGATVASAIAIVPGAASKVLFSEAARVSDPSALQVRATRTRKVVAVVAISVISLEIVAPLIVTLAFGDKFEGAVRLSVLLIVAYAAAGISAIIDEQLKASSFIRPGVLARLSYIAIITAGSVVLASKGIYSNWHLGLAMVAASVIELLLIANLYAKHAHIRLNDFLIPRGADFLEVTTHFWRRLRRKSN